MKKRYLPISQRKISYQNEEQWRRKIFSNVCCKKKKTHNTHNISNYKNNDIEHEKSKEEIFFTVNVIVHQSYKYGNRNNINK